MAAMRWFAIVSVGSFALFAGAQPVIDGSATDVLYGEPLVIQDTQTGFGDANLGRPDVCNGSELDTAHAADWGDYFYLVLPGNFESNGNHLEIFFDSRPGGQNRLLQTNPGPANQGLLRMSDDGSGNGLTFTPGFEADFWVSVAAFGDPVDISVDYAELYVDANNPGTFYFAGTGQTKCETNGGQLEGGDPGAPAILCTIDNSNVAGVDGGFGTSDGSGVTTGCEIAIPLAALGNPTSIKITAFINGQQHDFMSNQLLGGIFGIPSDNLGEPRAVKLAETLHEPFEYTLPATPRGACCVDDDCFVLTRAACEGLNGTYQGDNVSCDGNPCDGTPSGRCCIDDGYSGTCVVTTLDECKTLGGTYDGDGTTCDGCPCLLDPQGACCVNDECQLLTEAECAAVQGAYAGDYTNCTSNPCDFGACCIVVECEELFRFECEDQSGRFLGDGIVCTAGICAYTIETPHVAGSMQGWDPGATPMTEDPVGSHIWKHTFTGLDPDARYEFKITDGTWNNNLPSGNSWCFTDANGDITIIYDANFYNDGWLPQKDRLGLSTDPATWTAAGSFQGWNNANPDTKMEPQGDGIYMYSGTGLSPGGYEWKAVVTGSWDSISQDNRSVNTQNMPFEIEAASDTFKLYVDAIQGRVKVDIQSAICRGDLNCDGFIDFNDINDFVLALANWDGWKAKYPDCPEQNADVNGDNMYGGANGFGDINPFVALLASSGGNPIPCD